MKQTAGNDTYDEKEALELAAGMEWADMKARIFHAIADIMATAGRLDCAVDREDWEKVAAQEIFLMQKANALARLSPDLDGVLDRMERAKSKEGNGDVLS